MKKIISLIALSYFLSGCASLYVPPVPEYTLQDFTKIGLYVSVSKTPQHTHIGTTVFNNFVKEYDYDWKMDEIIFDTFKENIEANTSFKVVNLKETNLTINEHFFNLVEVKDKNWVHTENSQKIRDSLQRQGISAVISIIEGPTLAELNCSNYGCSEQYSAGYGLFTRSFFGFDRYRSSASFHFSGEIMDPPVDLFALKKMSEQMQYHKKNQELTEFKTPSDFKNLSSTEMLPVKQQIVTYIQSISDLATKYLDGKVHEE